MDICDCFIVCLKFSSLTVWRVNENPATSQLKGLNHQDVPLIPMGVGQILLVRHSQQQSTQSVRVNQSITFGDCDLTRFLLRMENEFLDHLTFWSARPYAVYVLNLCFFNLFEGLVLVSVSWWIMVQIYTYIALNSSNEFALILLEIVLMMRWLMSNI